MPGLGLRTLGTSAPKGVGCTAAGGRGVRRGRASAAVLGAALLLAGCSSGGDDGEGSAGSAVTQQPKEAAPFWVNPDGLAVREIAELREDGKKAEAEQLRKIAEQPVAEWISPENPEEQARGSPRAPTRPAAGRCWSSTTSRTATAASTRRAGPPTATPTGTSSTRSPRASGTARRRWCWNRTRCCTWSTAAPRRSTTRSATTSSGGAVATLKGLKNTKVYLDAGNAGWGNLTRSTSR